MLGVWAGLFAFPAGRPFTGTQGQGPAEAQESSLPCLFLPQACQKDLNSRSRNKRTVRHLAPGRRAGGRASQAGSSPAMWPAVRLAAVPGCGSACSLGYLRPPPILHALPCASLPLALRAGGRDCSGEGMPALPPEKACDQVLRLQDDQRWPVLLLQNVSSVQLGAGAVAMQGSGQWAAQMGALGGASARVVWQDCSLVHPPRLLRPLLHNSLQQLLRLCSLQLETIGLGAHTPADTAAPLQLLHRNEHGEQAAAAGGEAGAAQGQRQRRRG